MIAGARIRIPITILLATMCAWCQQPSVVAHSQAQGTPGQPVAGPAPTPPAAAPAPPNGEAIFQQRCAKCHGDKGQGVSAFVSFGGPNIQAVHDPSDVIRAMEVGPSHMPSFAKVLSIDEMRAVAQYVTQKLAVIPLHKGDLAQGGELFRVYCAPCHRTAVRGGVMVYTGMNAPELVTTSPEIIAGAIRWGPGDMPAFPPAVLNDRQLDSIVTYIEFVQHPPAPGGTPLNWYGPVAEGFVSWVVLFGIIAITGWIEKGGKG